MKLVFLDKKTIGEDIDFSPFRKLGDVVEYDFTLPEEVPERAADADVLIVNKIPVNEQTIHTASHLKLVCVTATGTNNLDKAYLDRRGIAWRNVAGYSTDSVAQHTFAMLFYLLEHLRYYDEYVKDRRYLNDTMFTHFARHFHQISGMTWGIIGLLQQYSVQTCCIIPLPDVIRRMATDKSILTHCCHSPILSRSMRRSMNIPKIYWILPLFKK